MPDYDPKRVRTLISTAAAHRMHPGGEIAMALAEQLGAVDEVIAAANLAATNALNAQRRANADLQTVGEELRQARALVSPLQEQLTYCVDALKKIAANAKGAKTVALTALGSAGISIEAPQPPATASSE